jgi:hypothetical protein
VTRKLRYSERKRLAETGSLGPLQDEPTDRLRNVIAHIYDQPLAYYDRADLEAGIRKAGIEFFGWSGAEAEAIRSKIYESHGEEFLDFVEIMVEEASKSTRSGGEFGLDAYIPGVESRLNDAFERHLFGYRFENSEIRKIGSPALDAEVVGPALLALQRSGYEEAQRSFQEALRHQRAGDDENDDALTAANAAVEAAMKAAGFKGANLGPLAKDFKKSDLVPAELKGVPEALDVLLSRSGALRSSYGDSHGKAAGAEPVPQALVDLAIHWAGAFIVYLAESVPAPES